ncbi:hypothetical protein SAMN04515669_5849 [Jiangella sp. DSM 45060]|nr:hypothetical protein SAMN04515669_5849 [Jiangella sp. DSM 45060]
MPRIQRCSVRLVGRHYCEHSLCVPIERPVPPQLRCNVDQPAGYGSGAGAACGCKTPADLRERVERELRDNIAESLRRGYVLIRVA